MTFPMISASSDELRRDFDRYLDPAETQPVFITQDEHVRLVVIPVDEYRRLTRQHDRTGE